MTGTANSVLPPMLATMATRDTNGLAANTVRTTPQLGDIRRINLSPVLRSIQRQGPITRQELPCAGVNQRPERGRRFVEREVWAGVGGLVAPGGQLADAPERFSLLPATSFWHSLTSPVQ